MKKINKTILVLIMAGLMYSCGGFKDAGKVLRNEKVSSRDEFLVKKREPLVLPPEYNTLPKPGSTKKNPSSNKNKISKILNIAEQQETSTMSSSVEQSILNKIGK
ncbi:MAG: Protein of unknown function (DUF3035) [Pelagibacterales bacterium]|nr:Protein of unknown function (DUF3035) [Pelagibacterales bacterium]